MTRARFTGYGFAAALVWLTCSCCHHEGTPAAATAAAAAAGSPARVAAAAAASPVLRSIQYTRTGGIMGTEDHIEVTSGGDVRVRGRMLGQREGHLSAEQQAELAAAFAGWNQLADDYPGRGADAFQYQIQFDHKKVAASQTADVPEPFRLAREKLEALVQSLPRSQ